jgi:hypothetical protein
MYPRKILLLQSLPLLYLFLDVLPLYGAYQIVLLLFFFFIVPIFFAGIILGIGYSLMHLSWKNLVSSLGLPILAAFLFFALPTHEVRSYLTQKILDTYWCGPTAPKTAQNILGEIDKCEIDKYPNGTFEVDEATCLMVACKENYKTYRCSR